MSRMGGCDGDHKTGFLDASAAAPPTRNEATRLRAVRDVQHVPRTCKRSTIAPARSIAAAAALPTTATGTGQGC